jgi:hypothetical protein
MSGWKIFAFGVATVAVSLWYARPKRTLPPDASWWSRSSRSYADWKGSWAPVMVPVGALIAVTGLALLLIGR